MADIYASLQRLRIHTRREAEQELRAAEAERDRARARLVELQDQVVRAREGVDVTDPQALEQFQSYRLREALRERREEARLAQREREVEQRGVRHLRSVRDELTLDAVVRLRDERLAIESRRTDARRMDEIAASLRKEAS